MSTPSGTDRKVTVLPDGMKPGDVKVQKWEGRTGWFHSMIQRGKPTPKNAYYSTPEAQALVDGFAKLGIVPSGYTKAPATPRAPRAPKPS